MASKTTQYNSVKGLNKALRSLPKHATVELRKASGKIADFVAADARSNARRVGGVAKLVEPTIKAGVDRVPVIKMGSAQKLPDRNGRPRKGKRQTIGDVIWGAEYGGGARTSTNQFMPWRGSDDGAGYFLWPAVREDSHAIQDEYSDALNDALKKVK